jgi:ATP dependent DNA ligase domain
LIETWGPNRLLCFTCICSTGYSPVLGPAIRKAFGWNDLDLILDGEVTSWDNAREETVPFGFNRAVARKRREYMEKNGLLDRRDRNLHKDEQDSKVFNMVTSWDGTSSEESADLTGRECWLQYIVFDVVYVGGPGAADFLSTTVSSYLKDLKPGCIMGLDLFERKKILYRLCRTQVNEVEIVPTLVVRPNGGVAVGSEYFSETDPTKENDHPAHKIDSIASVFVGHVPNIAYIDEKQRERLSDEEISQARANAIDRHYKEIVELRRLEGLVFKDLNTPYVLDMESRALRYWFKFKPDYFCGSIASDIDVVVVGAYFAVRRERRIGTGHTPSWCCMDTNFLVVLCCLYLTCCFFVCLDWPAPFWKTVQFPCRLFRRKTLQRLR